MSRNKKRQSGDNRQVVSGKRDASDRGSKQPDPKPGTSEEKKTTDVAKNDTSPGYASFASFRELIESVAIAFVLAFLFRTFEAEAFVIPTGSMATTLMGRHKDLVCPQCGCPYTVSASEEVDSLTNETMGKDQQIAWSTCPMCRYHQAVGEETSFSGDRILVSKFDYQLNPPNRWDVAVFMYPDDAKVNFIKRLVGLPNETLKISHGDLFIKKDGESSFSIARKPPEKYLAMARVVHDNDYSLPQKLVENGWPQRWCSPGPQATWNVSDDYRLFSTDGSKDAVLKYYHYLPDQQAWSTKPRNQFVPQPIKPQLITDDCGYNSGVSGNTQRGLGGLGLHWVGDLGVECRLDVRKASGSMIFELVEGGRKMFCDIDLSDGTANLTILGESFVATGMTPISKPGSYRVRFVNADDELRLWVDDELISFDKPTTFGPLGNQVPTEADLAPITIVSEKADVSVSHLRVLRDIYYIADKVVTSNSQGNTVTDFTDLYEVFVRRDPQRGPYEQGITEREVRAFYQTPERWSEVFADGGLMRSDVEFALKDKQYFMLGDNSPQSKDSRLWDPREYYVDESLLKGKALFIYWPHSWDYVELGGVRIPFWFFPNYKKMHLVR